VDLRHIARANVWRVTMSYRTINLTPCKPTGLKFYIERFWRS